MSKSIVVPLAKRVTELKALAQLNRTGQGINEDAACELASMIADEMDAITEIAEMIAEKEV